MYLITLHLVQMRYITKLLSSIVCILEYFKVLKTWDTFYVCWADLVIFPEPLYVLPSELYGSLLLFSTGLVLTYENLVFILSKGRLSLTSHFHFNFRPKRLFHTENMLLRLVSFFV